MLKCSCLFSHLWRLPVNLRQEHKSVFRLFPTVFKTLSAMKDSVSVLVEMSDPQNAMFELRDLIRSIHVHQVEQDTSR